MKHIFTDQECKRGGKIRAAQRAQWRRDNPTEAEAFCRDAVLQLIKQLPNAYCIFETPIKTMPDLEQYIDIALWTGNKWIAIEVDGSNGWHDNNQKSAPYDEIKARYCHDNNILLVLAVYRKWKKLGKDALADHILKILQGTRYNVQKTPLSIRRESVLDCNQEK